MYRAHSHCRSSRELIVVRNTEPFFTRRSQVRTVKNTHERCKARETRAAACFTEAAMVSKS
jgi:hypothetical protein